MFHGSCRAVPVNHRPLGYECHHQQNLNTMRGAKSNALFLRTANCNPACPCFAHVICPRSWMVVQRWLRRQFLNFTEIQSMIENDFECLVSTDVNTPVTMAPNPGCLPTPRAESSATDRRSNCWGIDIHMPNIVRFHEVGGPITGCSPST